MCISINIIQLIFEFISIIVELNSRNEYFNFKAILRAFIDDCSCTTITFYGMLQSNFLLQLIFSSVLNISNCLTIFFTISQEFLFVQQVNHYRNDFFILIKLITYL